MKNNTKLFGSILLAGWALAFAYFFGQLMWYVMPFPWPFNVVAGYVSGAIAGLLLAYYVLGKVESLATRAIIALVALAFAGSVSTGIVHLSHQITVMSLEIQELRDSAARQQ